MTNTVEQEKFTKPQKSFLKSFATLLSSNLIIAILLHLPIAHLVTTGLLRKVGN